MLLKFAGCYIILYPLPWVESCSTQLQTSRWWLVCPVQCVCQARAQLQDTPAVAHTNTKFYC